MGIPRLLQDVEPYARTVELAASSESDNVLVKQLVIDGPSMVYHVYNALARVHHISDEHEANMIPSYAKINRATAHFLNNLELNGTTIVGIVFDGALPVAKRPIRQERLEKTRQQLGAYRKSHSQLRSSHNLSSPAVQPGQTVDEVELFNSALWNAPIASSTHASLPAPPYMVPGVIEYLCSSKWSQIVHLVPGEADAYCAGVATVSNAAILSNDSDLLLYDLDRDGIVIFLRTLEYVVEGSGHVQSRVRAQGFTPTEIAKKLNVPNMKLFGFYRSNNKPLRTSAVAQLARGQMNDESKKAWNTFRKEYYLQKIPTLSPGILSNSLHCSIRGLDPRIAELVCSLQRSEPPHMYLPTVLEDPTRDSAWSYGFEIRQVAYSLLLSRFCESSTSQNCDNVLEYARRGDRISSNTVRSLSVPALVHTIERLIAAFEKCDCRDLKLVNSYLHKIVCSTADTAAYSPKAKTVFAWYRGAASLVARRCMQNSKPYQLSLSRLFGPASKTASASNPTDNLLWEELHLLAAIQCVLYSIRLMAQVCEWHERRPKTKSGYDSAICKLAPVIRDLHTTPVADLFTDPRILRMELFYHHHSY